jgi:uncharacterized protein YbaR (Trm112 family)
MSRGGVYTACMDGEFSSNRCGGIVSIDPSLLEILACPACQGAISEVEAGLQCGDCGRLYPIRDGVPVMLVDEATRPETSGEN